MLKAFTASPVVELKPRDKSKIETVLAYGKLRRCVPVIAYFNGRF